MTMAGSWGEYEGKKTVIVGCATGMGAATAQLLVAAGAEVHPFDVKPVELAGLASSHTINLMEQASIDAAIELMGDGIDALFSCAGLPTGFSWADTLTVNFFGPRYMIDKLLPKMNSGGAIATIASLTLGWERQVATINEALSTSTIEEGRAWVDNIGDRWPDPYSFSKYCLAAWTTFECQRMMEDHGVRLNTLGPGVTSSPMLASFRETSAENMDKQPNPIGRWSTPQEQGQAMMFLNSPNASYLTGAILPNDGGLHAALLAGAMKAALEGE
jgi:NAD(P)-dependent dehydrogenase (short-subunit alcohol dehydrogenase family)